MGIIKKINDHLEEYILVPLFAVMVIVLFSQIIMRSIFNSSITWSEELARYCFIYIVFIGISYAVKKNAHLSLTLIVSKLGKVGQKAAFIFSNSVFFLFCLFILYYSAILTMNNFKFGQVTPSLGIHMAVVYAAAPIGMSLTIIRLIQHMYSHFKTNDFGSIKEGEVK